jgi:hypothetical protein
MFRVSDDSWHGYLPHQGLCLSLQLCYCDTESYAKREYFRYNMSALAKAISATRVLDQADLSLYGEPLNSGEIVDIKRVGLRLPLPVQMFVDHVNRELGDTTHEVDWKVSAPPPKP